MKNYFSVLLWALFIFALSVGPSPNLPDTLDFEPDKLAHAFVYGVLVYLAFRAYNLTHKRINSPTIIAIVFLASLYGLLLEIIQKLFFPYRFFEWGDVVANITGAFLGWVIFSYIANRKNKNKK